MSEDRSWSEELDEELSWCGAPGGVAISVVVVLVVLLVLLVW